MTDFKMASVTDDWRSTNSRQNMVSKIEEAIQNCGSATSKNAVEMESQVFAKAKSKDEYLSFVARLLIHIKEMTAKNQASGNHPAAGQQGNSMQPMMGMPQQSNLGMVNQMNNMGVNVNTSMGQQNFGMNNAGQMQILSGHPQSTSPMVGQQMQQQQIQQQHIQQQQLQQQQMQQQHQLPPHQLQQQQQMNQSQQIIGPGFMQSQQQHMQQQQMQNLQLQQGQLQQNPQLQGMLASQQQQQQLIAARGMTNPQMVQNRMMASQPNMANQLSQMAQQQQRKEGSVGMLGGQYGTNQMTMRPMGQSQFMPSVPAGVSSGSVASPDRPPGNQSHGYANSPGSASMMHSPAGPGINVNNTMRPFQGHYGAAPSPGSSLNTPHSIVGATPSPRTADDVACFEKIKDLRKYTPLLERMIAKIGNDDVEKSSKMKKLLEILVNPNQRVSMEILLKCEIALKKMEKQNDVGVGIPVSAQGAPGKEQSTPFQHLLESAVTTMTHPSAAHTCRRTFQPALDALLGHSFGTSNDDDESEDDSLDSEDGLCEIPWVLQKQLQQLDNSRFKISSAYPGLDSSFGIILDCVLADPRLPSVPHLKVKIPPTYPDDSPTILDLDSTFATTPFFSAVGAALKSRMYYFLDKYTLPELLNAWEMSVRQACGPNFKIPDFFHNEQTIQPIRMGL